MNLKQRIAGWFVTPVDMQFSVPPADIVPGFPSAVGIAAVPPRDDAPAAVEVEEAVRVREALRLVEAALAAESARARKTGMRNPDLANLALELRSALRPAPADAEVLREVPPVGVRQAVPSVPGRAA